ncbi:MAG: hypothetical protein P8Z39_08455 [Gammaproteobacteria bacterium]
MAQQPITRWRELDVVTVPGKQFSAQGVFQQLDAGAAAMDISLLKTFLSVAVTITAVDRIDNEYFLVNVYVISYKYCKFSSLIISGYGFSGPLKHSFFGQFFDL